MIRDLPPKETGSLWLVLTPCANANPGRALVGGPATSSPRTPAARSRCQAATAVLQARIPDLVCAALGWPFPGLTDVYFDAKLMEERPNLADAESLLPRQALEECVYLQPHLTSTGRAFGSQEISYFMDGLASSSETVQRLEKRFAPAPTAALQWPHGPSP